MEKFDNVLLEINSKIENNHVVSQFIVKSLPLYIHL